MIIAPVHKNEYKVDSYEPETGKHLGTLLESTEDLFEAFNVNHDNKSKKSTTFTTVRSTNPIAKVRDRLEDVQNDLFWSSYTVGD